MSMVRGTHFFLFYSIDFQLNTHFSSKFCIFLPENHQTLLKDWFLKKMLLKRAKKNQSPFFCKTVSSNNSFTLIENSFSFLR